MVGVAQAWHCVGHGDKGKGTYIYRVVMVGVAQVTA